MTSCSPKCKDDSECFGKKCCPNVCNAKSCVPDHLRDSNKNDGYKNQNSSKYRDLISNLVLRCSLFYDCSSHNIEQKMYFIK